MEPCPYSVGRCDVLRTCPCCKRLFDSRSGRHGHQYWCREPLDVEYAEYQHEHWRANHDHRAEQARRRRRR